MDNGPNVHERGFQLRDTFCGVEGGLIHIDGIEAALDLENKTLETRSTSSINRCSSTRRTSTTILRFIRSCATVRIERNTEL